VNANPTLVSVEEGSTLVYERAELGLRAAAFAVDVLLALLGVLLLSVVVMFVSFLTGLTDFGTATVQVTFFFAVFVFFAWREASRVGATPGKRMMRIRVLDGRGRVLTPYAAFVRNAIRWFELSTPLLLLLSGKEGFVGAPWSQRFLYVALAGFVAVPFVRGDGRRLGDLAAGTVVVKAPRARLERDLATRARAPIAFSDAELDVYGERELHALEDLLRAGRDRFEEERLGKAAEIIATKIGRAKPELGGARAWLEAFYAALRGRLERRLAAGRRKRDKFEAS
jgi:uncharacterized RDD family membrane protein YckC